MAIYDKDCADGYKIRGAEGKKKKGLPPTLRSLTALMALTQWGHTFSSFSLLPQRLNDYKLLIFRNIQNIRTNLRLNRKIALYLPAKYKII